MDLDDTKKRAMEIAQDYWEVCLAQRKEELAELLEDQVEALEEESPQKDLSSSIINMAREIEKTEVILKQIKKL